MLFGSMSKVTRRTSRPTYSCVVRFTVVTPSPIDQQIASQPEKSFKTTFHIQNHAGGIYGDEFRPN